ncbi:MAG: hypothetical protein BroJett018_44090 [Chloroflexota bacterium]|nr:hypothetical protein [Chloroflexota bacterium]GIK66615.1 MAG: hypothetical protein BroJett018_44090 [Chloroflexota bacterium]
MDDKIVDYSNLPEPDPTIPPEEMLARFKTELRHLNTSIKGYAELISGKHGIVSPDTQREYGEIISKVADIVFILLADIQKYLDARKTLE